MFAFLIDNIFVMFGGRVFQQTVGFLMGTKCALPRRLVPLFVRGRFHTDTSQEIRKEVSLSL